MDGKRPILAFRSHQGVTLQELSERTGLTVSYLTEIERGIRPGSPSASVRITDALGTTIDVLVSE